MIESAAMTDAATLDALAFLYIAFGHSTDDALTAEEMRALAGHLQTWAPDAGLEPVGAALKSAVGAYRKEPSARDKLTRALEKAKILAATLPDDARPKVLADLRSIAEADGNVSPEEQSMMNAVAKVLGV